MIGIGLNEVYSRFWTVNIFLSKNGYVWESDIINEVNCFKRCFKTC